MKTYLSIAQIITAILLMVVILLQSKGAGLSGVFGGEGNVYQTKRGAEKFLFTSTIILAIIFLGLAFTNILLVG